MILLLKEYVLMSEMSIQGNKKMHLRKVHFVDLIRRR